MNYQAQCLRYSHGYMQNLDARTTVGQRDSESQTCLAYLFGRRPPQRARPNKLGTPVPVAPSFQSKLLFGLTLDVSVAYVPYLNSSG